MPDQDVLEQGELLCSLAGRRPDEVIVSFTLSDYAASLLSAGLDEAAVLAAVRSARLAHLTDAFLEASGWMEIFAECHDAEAVR